MSTSITEAIQYAAIGAAAVINQQRDQQVADLMTQRDHHQRMEAELGDRLIAVTAVLEEVLSVAAGVMPPVPGPPAVSGSPAGYRAGWSSAMSTIISILTPTITPTAEVAASAG